MARIVSRNAATTATSKLFRVKYFNLSLQAEVAFRHFRHSAILPYL
jgi:hypothetical protein